MIAVQKKTLKEKFKKIKEQQVPAKTLKLNPQAAAPPPKPQILAPQNQVAPVLKAQPKFELTATPKQVEGFFNNSSDMLKRLDFLFQKFMEIQKNPEKYIVADKAHCLRMCDELQLADNSRPNSNFEKNQKGQQTELLAVKKFIRSDAGKMMNEPAIIRPPHILYLTMVYLRDCVVDQDLIAPG